MIKTALPWVVYRHLTESKIGAGPVLNDFMISRLQTNSFSGSTCASKMSGYKYTLREIRESQIDNYRLLW